MKKLVFIHGWGFSSDFWSALIAELSEFSVHTIDLGFIGDLKDNSALIEDMNHHPETYIAIGHSLGFLYLLKTFPLKFDHYVALNSFAKFAKSQDFPNGMAPRVIDRMIKGIENNIYQTINQFYKQCGLSHQLLTSIKVSQSRLKKGLECLRDEDYRDVVLSVDEKLTIIASSDDPVVSKQMVIDSFGDKKKYILTDNSHILPITHVKECAKIIREIDNIYE